MSKKILDNLTGQEIKELINTKRILLEDLDSDSLRKLMDHEVDMICYGEGDVDLITQCSDILSSRDTSMISKYEFMDIIERTKAERVIIVDKIDNKLKRRIILKRTLLIAALASILLFSSGCVLIKLGVDIFQYISDIVRQPEGFESNIDDFTFYHNGEAKKYNSIKEMMESEDLDIMYPTKWPEGVELEYIISDIMTNDNTMVEFVTNENDINIQIQLNAVEINKMSDDVFEHNNLTYYIQCKDSFMAICYYNNNIYYISANSREDLITIIKNLKE